MKEIKIVIKLPDFQLFFKKTKRFLTDKKLELILFIIILGLLNIWQFNINITISIMGIFVLLFYGMESKFVVRSLIKVKEDIVNKKLCTISLVIILSLLLIWKFSVEAIILWMIICTFLFYGWDNRIITGTALVFLMSCPILLILEKENTAEEMAIYAYYFLVMAVVLRIVEYWKESKEKKTVDER